MNLLLLPFHFARLFTLCYILQVGPTYGRKIMTGYLRQKLGTAIGQNCVDAALAKVHSGNHRKRQNKSEKQPQFRIVPTILVINYTLIKMKNWSCTWLPPWLQLTDTVALWLQLVHHQLKTIF